MKYLDPLAVDSETSFQIVASGRPDFGTISITVKCYERKRIAKFNHILPKPIEYENDIKTKRISSKSFASIIHDFLTYVYDISFWTPGLPDGVLGNRPCPSVRPSVLPSFRLEIARRPLIRFF